MRPSRLTALFCVWFLLAGVAALDAATRQKSGKPSTTRSKMVKAKQAGKSSSRGKKKRTARRSGPPRQSSPTPERYAEIQRALADKGYYAGPQDGVWSADCTSALRRFQADRNLVVDGKLGARSLIELGLGPKRGPDADVDVAVRPSSEPAVEP